MHSKLVTLLPCFLDDSGITYVLYLLDDIQLAEQIQLVSMRQTIELVGMEAEDIFDVAEPVIDEPMPLVLQSSLDTTAAIMPADDDVFHLEDLDRILDDRKTVQIRMYHHIRDVAVHKYFARLKTGYLIGGNPTVRTPDPEILG